MALLEVKVPQLSESVTEASLLEWHKKAGEPVRLDENLVDIETDKVVLELPCPGNGVLADIIKPDGSVVHSGEVIATVDTSVVIEPPMLDTVPETASQPEAGLSEIPEADDYPAGIIMPAAEKMIVENAVDPAQLQGTGKGGRITVSDVQRAMAEKYHQTSSSPSVPQESQVFQPTASIGQQTVYGNTNRIENRVPMTRLRARVAERLIQSQQSTASLTTFNEVSMKPVLDLRRKFGEAFEKEHGVRLGIMSFFVKAVVAALKRYPIVNASIDGSDIVYHGYFDIGIAVSSPRGLVVPILRDADLMTIAEIEQKIHELSDKAQNNQLTLEDLTGGTFSISNGGVFGSMLSTPIINPPQSAILGVHATKERPVVENGEIVIRPMNYLALSYDHRLIDGREAVLALRTIKETLEDPAKLLLDL